MSYFIETDEYEASPHPDNPDNYWLKETGEIVCAHCGREYHTDDFDVAKDKCSDDCPQYDEE